MAASLEPSEFIINGGSLAGLFTGVALSRLGHNVRILERTPTSTLRDYGAGLVFGAETQDFLAKYDVTKRPLAVESPARYYLNKKGEEIDEQEWMQRMTSWDAVYATLRRNFDGLEVSRGKNDEQSLSFASEWNEECKKNGWKRGTYESGAKVTSFRTASQTGRMDGKVEVTIEHASKDLQQPSAAIETATADYLVAADGPNSLVRNLLFPTTERNYAGYVLWRGTVPESSLSASARSTFTGKFIFYHSEGLQAIGYLIPGPFGSLTPGSRTVNWGVYRNFALDSSDLRDLMLDKNGTQHRYTLPRGMIRPEIWTAHKADFQARLPPQFAEIVCGTTDPFVQSITDVHAPQAVHEDCILLVGDALCGLRPHTAAGTSQAARGAMRIAAWANGEVGLEEMARESVEWSKQKREHGIRIGDRSQFGIHPLAD